MTNSSEKEKETIPDKTTGEVVVLPKTKIVPRNAMYCLHCCAIQADTHTVVVFRKSFKIGRNTSEEKFKHHLLKMHGL